MPGAGPGAADAKAWKGWLGLLGVGQENFLGFLLFWIGSYALIHGGSTLLLKDNAESSVRLEPLCILSNLLLDVDRFCLSRDVARFGRYLKLSTAVHKVLTKDLILAAEMSAA